MSILPPWLRSMLGLGGGLAREQVQRLQRWQALPKHALNAPMTGARCVVVDVETSGLNLRRDRLISIGAVAIVNGRIDISDSFSVVLQQEKVSDKENILLHEISGSVQRAGMTPAEALLGFLEYVGKDPLVAFHVTFDRTMITRAIRQYLGFSFRQAWLDLAYIMPGLHPDMALRLHTLDDWSARYSIHNEARHNALSDAYATAQLLLVGMAHARHKNITSYEGLLYLEKLHRSLHVKY